MAYACNPNYSGGSDQEDHRLKPDLENDQHKKGLVEWLKW
jgi:hypothetical protein